MAGKRQFDIPEAKLRELYLKQRLSLQAVAEICGCSPGTVRNELLRNDLPLRSHAAAAESKRLKLPKSRLEELYLRQAMSGPEIGEVLGCSISVVYRELARHQIPRRTKQEVAALSRAKLSIREGMDEAVLRRLYHGQQMSEAEVAESLGCSASTVRRRMAELRIEKRTQIETRKLASGKLRFEVSQDILEDLYVKQGLSAEAIGEQLGCSSNVVRRRLEEYQMSRRSAAEAATRYPKTDFGGDPKEKAYLIGFRQGDLHVTKPNEAGITLVVTCSSTKREQIALIHSLFERYGRVCVTGPDSKRNLSVSCLVNESFDFLLKKEDDIPAWILTDDECFLAFFAGYADAEANIGVYGGKARFRIDSYDKTIIRKSHSKLASLGIRFPRPYIDRKKGTVSCRRRGGVYHQDRWLLETKRQASLLQLFDRIEPYLKHAKRRQDMARAIENIRWRNETYGNLNR
jgi:biotin operon repressor